MKTKVIATIILSIITVNAQAVITMGSRGCGDWVKEHEITSPSIRSVAQESWLVGFLSGLAFESDLDLLKNEDAESLFLYVTNHCRANPLNNTTDAGYELFKALAKKKGLKYQ